jgi:hypothetical protein
VTRSDAGLQNCEFPGLCCHVCTNTKTKNKEQRPERVVAVAMRIKSKQTGALRGLPLTLWWSISIAAAFTLGVFYANFLLNDPPVVGTIQVQDNAPVAGTAKASMPRQLLNLPDTIKYVYINIGTSWDPWPGECCLVVDYGYFFNCCNPILSHSNRMWH